MNFYPFYRRDIKINTASLDKDDLKRLFSLVQAQLDKAVDIQIANTNPDLFSDFEAVKQEIRDVFIIYYSIRKKKGDTVSGYNVPDFDSTTFPEQIETVFLTTKSTFEAHVNAPPRNNLEILLDFKKTRLSIDFITLPSNPTDNSSIANISGLEESWVIETYDKLKEFFDARLNRRGHIHRSGIYDAFLYIVVIPIFLYAFYRFEVKHPEFIDRVPKITIIAIYVYSFLFIGVVGRVLFQDARWLFPLVEYTSDRRWSPTAQRALLLTVTLGMISAAVYDAIKFFLS